MRILHLIQKTEYRGAEIFTCQLASHQKKLGMEVQIASIFEGSSKLDWEDGILQLEGQENSRFFDYRAWKNLSNLIAAFKPDIIQANAGDTLKYTVFSKKIFGWRVPIIFRNASEVGRYLKSPIQKSLNSFFYKNIEFVISVSKASEKDILNHFPFLSGKTQVIPVGLETISKIEKIILEPKDSQHIVHVGGFSFEKNHFRLLKIFESALNSKPNIHLHLVGDGPLRSEIEEEVKKMNLTKYITFYGFVNNPLSYIKAAKVLVLPSIIEGLPGVLLEAMMCKTSVVAYNVGGISEIVTSQAGNLIEKDNEANFVNAIVETLENPKLAQIEAAHQMVLKEYMNEEIALKFIEVYEAVAK